MTMSVTREAIEEWMNKLSIKSQRLQDLYKLHDIQFGNDESLQSCVNNIVEHYNDRFIEAQRKLILKQK